MGDGDRFDPGWGYGGPRYPGTFFLALEEAFAGLQWQLRRWLLTGAECIDPQGREQTIGLENLYRRVRREERAGWPGLLSDLLRQVPRDSLEQPPEDLHAVADRILVRLGPPFAREEKDSDVWCQPIVAGHLVASLVVDFPQSMSYVTEKMISDSGQDGDYWLGQAVENLLATTPTKSLAVVHEDSGLLQSEVGDAYDSSRALLLSDLLPGHEAHGFFVALPGRDHLLVLPVSARSFAFLPWLRAIADKTFRQLPYPISGEIFWVRQTNWHLFPIDLRGQQIRIMPPREFLEVMSQLTPSSDETSNPPSGGPDLGP